MTITERLFLPEHYKKVSNYSRHSSQSSSNKIKEICASVISLCNLHRSEEEIRIIDDVAKLITDNFSQAIIIGIGGAISSSRIYTSSINYSSSKFKLLYSASLSKTIQDLIFTPENLKKSAIIVFSKSGETVETLVQVISLIKKYTHFFGSEFNIGKHFYIVSSNNNTLSEIGSSIGATILDYSAKSGKFSEFSLVGLLPAKLLDLSITDIVEGASKTIGNANKIFDFSAIQYKLIEYKFSSHVFAVYRDELLNLASWYNQISAEICAKNNYGINSIATSISEQHSLWQLFLSGPKDKFFTLLCEESSIDDCEVNDLISNSYFKLNKKFLKYQEIPFREIIVDKFSAKNLGSLVMRFLLENMILADFNNICPIKNDNLDRSKKILKRMYSKKILANFKNEIISS